jgi:hypothetical protein
LLKIDWARVDIAVLTVQEGVQGAVVHLLYHLVSCLGTLLLQLAVLPKALSNLQKLADGLYIYKLWQFFHGARELHLCHLSERINTLMVEACHIESNIKS